MARRAVVSRLSPKCHPCPCPKQDRGTSIGPSREISRVQRRGYKPRCSRGRTREIEVSVAAATDDSIAYLDLKERLDGGQNAGLYRRARGVVVPWKSWKRVWMLALICQPAAAGSPATMGAGNIDRIARSTYSRVGVRILRRLRYGVGDTGATGLPTAGDIWPRNAEGKQAPDTISPELVSRDLRVSGFTIVSLSIIMSPLSVPLISINPRISNATS